MDERVLTVRSRVESGYVRVHCPFHEDHNPSASLRFEGGRPVALYCFGPCADGKGPARFRVVEAVLEGDGWRVTLRPGGGAPRPRAKKPRASAGKGKEAKRPGAEERGESLVSQPAVEAALQIAIEWIRSGRGTTRETFCLWEPFLRAKHVCSSIEALLSLECPPVFSPTAIIYPLLPLTGGPAEPRYQIRLAAGAKGRFYPPGTSSARVWTYAPRGVRVGARFVVVEAPHHALRIAMLLPAVLPIAALGIGNIPRVAEAASAIGRVAAVFCDERVGFPGAVALDIDEENDDNVMRAILTRLR